MARRKIRVSDEEVVEFATVFAWVSQSARYAYNTFPEAVFRGIVARDFEMSEERRHRIPEVRELIRQGLEAALRARAAAARRRAAIRKLKGGAGGKK
jgi:hypothetical protein